MEDMSLRSDSTSTEESDGDDTLKGQVPPLVEPDPASVNFEFTTRYPGSGWKVTRKAGREKDGDSFNIKDLDLRTN